MSDHSIESVLIQIPGVGSGERPLMAYFSHPEDDGPFPGVVVIHEISGLNENIKEISDRFARHGYAALAVDLFSLASRVVCMARIFHGMILRPLNNSVVRDLQSALNFLGSMPRVDTGRLGAIGFCLGGSYALQLACLSNDMQAASVFYGMNPRPLEVVAESCPVVGSFPERDFTARAARQLEQALEKSAVTHDIKVYPDAQHSFFNDRGGSYNAEAAADAWHRTISFFEIHLNNKEPGGG